MRQPANNAPHSRNLHVSPLLASTDLFHQIETFLIVNFRRWVNGARRQLLRFNTDQHRHQQHHQNWKFQSNWKNQSENYKTFSNGITGGCTLWQQSNDERNSMENALTVYYEINRNRLTGLTEGNKGEKVRERKKMRKRKREREINVERRQ